jgi:hypothetical protein
MTFQKTLAGLLLTLESSLFARGSKSTTGCVRLRLTIASWLLNSECGSAGPD